MNTIQHHWKSLVGLVLVALALIMNWNWMWGALFLFWLVPSLITGVAYLGEPIERKQTPFLFWFVTVLWLGLSGYMAVEPLLPVEYRTTTTASIEELNRVPKDAVPAVALGDYQDPVPVAKDVLPPPAIDSLGYQNYRSPEQHFIGVATPTTYQGDQYLKDMEELWAWFMENDISEGIPNIVDERVYLVYSDYDQPNDGDFKMTLGYRTKDLSYIYEGLEGLTIPATDFAVFTMEKGADPETFIGNTWQQVATSNLPRANQYDVEVYQFDEKATKITGAELRVSIKK